MTPASQAAHFIDNRRSAPAGGGTRHSGHGREKGFEALPGFTSLKTIAIRHD